MMTVTAIQPVKPGQNARLEALMKDLTIRVRQEPGCVTFEYFRARENPDSYLVIEQYRDQAALDVHLKTDYLQEFIPKMMECLAQPPTVMVYEDVFTDLPNQRKET
jgi:quinol monooxygenase YgiN